MIHTLWRTLWALFMAVTLTAIYMAVTIGMMWIIVTVDEAIQEGSIWSFLKSILRF